MSPEKTSPEASPATIVKVVGGGWVGALAAAALSQAGRTVYVIAAPGPMPDHTVATTPSSSFLSEFVAVACGIPEIAHFGYTF